jgi:endonuclease/exonuclease/phosphatase family metal-dependent hydrolase
MLNEAWWSAEDDPTSELSQSAGLPTIIRDPYIALSGRGLQATTLDSPLVDDSWYAFGSAIALPDDADIVSVNSVPLPLEGDWQPATDVDVHMPRSALVVRCRLALGAAREEVTFITAHLTPQRDHRPDSFVENERQFLAIIDLAKSIVGPVVVGGDFNIRADRELSSGELPHQALRDAGLVSEAVGPTHLRHADAEVDYLAGRGAVRLAEGAALSSLSARAVTLPISDHRLITAELEFTAEVDIRVSTSVKYRCGVPSGA